MHNLIMADRQDKILGERIVQPECHLVMVVFTINRILSHVGQRVIHPPHVPF